MKSGARLIVALAVLAAAPAAAKDQPGCAQGKVANPAINCPDMFAWQKFVEVNMPAGNGLSTFQTWSSDADTFQCPPADLKTCKANPNAAGCPVWPGKPTFKPSAITQRSALATGAPSHRSQVPEDNCWNYYGSNNTELVYRNRATFDYIAQNGLWYVEGAEDAFEQGFVFNFPVEAIEVKSNWLPLSQEQVKSGRYHTMTLNGQILGLVAMHLSTKDLPNWFWSTFEHVDLLGRCDFIGCHDSFGVTPANVPTKPQQLCTRYPPGEITPALSAMLEKLPPVFRNYRLKGSMTDFTDATGKPNLLGNTVTEAGFVQTSSCMTCHSRATIQATSGPPNGLSPYPGIAGFTPTGQSYHGTPDPDWYSSNNDPLTRWSVQTDFVWAIPFKANSVKATKACCDAGGPCQCFNNQGQAIQCQ